MNYHERDPDALRDFFGEWTHYAAINSLAGRPASERFQAFRAAWTWHDASTARQASDGAAPPEYVMLLDWVAAESSGYWEPVSNHP